MAEAKVVNKQGQKEPFRENKVYHSVYYPAVESGYDEEEADTFAEEVVDALRDWTQDHDDAVFTTGEVRDQVRSILQDRDEDVCFMYDTHLDLS